MRNLLLALVVVAACCSPFAAKSESQARRFSDVPEKHWAAESVKTMADKGVLKGYPDASFRGDRPVTRYELAVALARFAELMEASHKPLEPKSGKARESKANLRKLKDSAEWLVNGQYLPTDSSLLRDGNKRVTESELSKSMASVAARIIEKETPEPDSND